MTTRLDPTCLPTDRDLGKKHSSRLSERFTSQASPHKSFPVPVALGLLPSLTYSGSSSRVPPSTGGHTLLSVCCKMDSAVFDGRVGRGSLMCVVTDQQDVGGKDLGGTAGAPHYPRVLKGPFGSRPGVTQARLVTQALVLGVVQRASGSRTPGFRLL